MNYEPSSSIYIAPISGAQGYPHSEGDYVPTYICTFEHAVFIVISY